MRVFAEPQNDMEGLKSFRTPLGLAVMADTSNNIITKILRAKLTRITVLHDIVHDCRNL